MTYGPGNFAVRSEKYRYIRYNQGDEELYDMQNDPSEFTNIAGQKQHANIIEQLKNHLPSEYMHNDLTGRWNNFRDILPSCDTTYSGPWQMCPTFK